MATIHDLPHALGYEVRMESRREVDAFSKGACNNKDVIVEFMKVLDDSKQVMERIIVDETYSAMCNRPDLHYLTWLREVFKGFSVKVGESLKGIVSSCKRNQIMAQMTELQGLVLPNLLEASGGFLVMKSLFCEEINREEKICSLLVLDTHNLAKQFAVKIVHMCAEAYPRLEYSYRKKLEVALDDSLSNYLQYVARTLRKERCGVYTVNGDDYLKYMSLFNVDFDASRYGSDEHDKAFDAACIDLKRAAKDNFIDDEAYLSALQIQMKLVAYWNVVRKRLVDQLALEILFLLKGALLGDYWAKVLEDMMQVGA